MNNIQEKLNQFVKLYSMDYKSEESIETLFKVLAKANENFHNSVLIEAFKHMPEITYQALVDFMKKNAFFDEFWLFEIYRNAPAQTIDPIVVEEFSDEDLSFLK